MNVALANGISCDLTVEHRDTNTFTYPLVDVFQNMLVGKNGSLTGCFAILRYKNKEPECQNVC